jgi:hypothetical protein
MFLCVGAGEIVERSTKKARVREWFSPIWGVPIALPALVIVYALIR